MSMRQNTPLVLLILDGWGMQPMATYNAIATAKTTQWNAWWKTQPHGLLQASGMSVGLPDGQMGNSEVGHMHLGAGRVILQDLTRINQAIITGSFAKQPLLLNLIEDAKHDHPLHVIGLLSPGGVHSHEDHLFAFLSLCQQQTSGTIALHLFLDGRDVPPKSTLASLTRLAEHLLALPNVRIASLCGRYDAMDRDTRFDRTKRAYQLITQGEGVCQYASAIEAVHAHYQAGYTDEFIPPTVIGQPLKMQAGDSLFCFNFRSDRIRQLMAALVMSTFSGFERPLIAFHRVVSLTQYDPTFPVEVLFPPMSLAHTLGAVLSENGLTQLRLAETEKYAHVTFFFNGGEEAPYPGESRCLIPSPKVKTYDLAPEMSARLITDQLVADLQAKAHEVIICNYANADMLGHTGKMEAACTAITCLDQCIKRVAEVAQAVGGCVMITADHGNAEVMFDDATGQPHTAHTSNPVPFLFVGKGWRYQATSGSLIDVAPTILHVLGLTQPKEMTGHTLLERVT